MRMSSTPALISCNAALSERREGGWGRKKTRGERTSHKVESMHGRRIEGRCRSRAQIDKIVSKGAMGAMD